MVLICGDVTLVGTCFQFHLKSGADDDDDDDDDDYPNKCCGLITVQYLIVAPLYLIPGVVEWCHRGVACGLMGSIWSSV